MSTARMPPKVGSESSPSPAVAQTITDVAFPATAAPTGRMMHASHQLGRINSVNLLSLRVEPNVAHSLEVEEERWENSFSCLEFLVLMLQSIPLLSMLTAILQLTSNPNVAFFKSKDYY